MSMLLSSNLASCRSKSCSCLELNAHDSSIPPSFTKPLPLPLELQTSISLDKIAPIVSQASAIDITPSKPDAPDTNKLVNSQASRSFDHQSAKRGKESEGLNDPTLEIVLEHEQGIATLENHHLRISLDIDTARHALTRIEEEHAKERVCSLAAHSALGAQLLGNLQAQLKIQKYKANESSVQDGLLDSLRTIRAQYAKVSRALRDESRTNVSLTADLQAERAARKLAEDGFADLLKKNFILVEHNQLLITRDTILQNDISSLISKSAADNWTRLALEDKLRLASSARTFGKDVVNLVSHSSHPPIPITPQAQELLVDSLMPAQGTAGPSVPTSESRHAALRAQLVVVQDELHIAKRQLSATEERCDALSAKVSLLQNHISTCVDECGAALEVERELRYEVEERVHELLCETTALKGQAKVIECKAECKRTSMGAWKETGGQVDPMSGIVVAVFERCDTLEEENLKLIRELSENVVTHEGLQTEVNKLKEDVVRYEKIVTGLQMKEKERTVDMRLKTQAGRRLTQRKRKRAILNVHIYDERIHSLQGLARFCNLSTMKQVMRHRPASVRMIKALVKAFPVILVRQAKRLSKALTEYSMAELNNLVNVSPSLAHDPQLRGVPFV